MFKLLKILTFPIWFSFLLIWSFVFVAFALSVFLFGFASVLSFIIAEFLGIIVIILGLGIFAIDIFTSIISFGFAFILFGLGLIMAIIGISICTKAVPKIFAFTKKMLVKPFKSR